MSRFLYDVQLLDKFLGTVQAVGNVVKPDQDHPHMRLLYVAYKDIGVKEFRGSPSNPIIEKYHAFATEDNEHGVDDSIPWCSSALCYWVEVAGMQSVNSKAARSWLGWGKSVKSHRLPGDLVVYWRGSRNGWMGHCGVYLGENARGIWTLGGNQNDEVNITQYSDTRLLDIRRSSKAPEYSENDVRALWGMSKRIRKGHPIQPPGKVT